MYWLAEFKCNFKKQIEIWDFFWQIKDGHKPLLWFVVINKTCLQIMSLNSIQHREQSPRFQSFIYLNGILIDELR